MLAIFTTLSEAVRLGSRNLILVIALSLVELIPCELMAVSVSARHPHFHANPMAFLGLAAYVMYLAMLGIKSAMIIGALECPESPWQAGFKRARSFTGSLIWLKLLITFVASLFALPIFAVANLLRAHGAPPSQGSSLEVAILAIVFLVFVKYALADPLVVVEGMKAGAALEQSWRLTKGRAGYVFGCIVCLAALNFFTNTVCMHLGDIQGVTLAGTIQRLLDALIGCLSILTAWCMYVRIKAANSVPPPFTPST